MRRKYLLLWLPIFLLAACSSNTKNSSSTNTDEPTIPVDPDPTNPEEEDPEEDPEDPDPGTTDPVDPDPVDPEPVEEEIPEIEKTLLDCGYYQMDLPKNYNNPYELTTTLSADLSSWSNNELYDELPTDFRFIYGNSCDDGESGHVAKPKFYSYDYSNPDDYPGGLKFDQISKGFQTQLFEHTGAKLEIRLLITQVNNASDKPDKGEDFIRFYYFNKSGELLGQSAIGPEEIRVADEGKEYRFYVQESYTSEIAYFEARQISMNYKGNQCYNVGIGYCNFKSWERAS